MNMDSLTKVFSPEDARQTALDASRHPGLLVDVSHGYPTKWRICTTGNRFLALVTGYVEPDDWYVAASGTSKVWRFSQRDDALDLAFYVAELMAKADEK